MIYEQGRRKIVIRRVGLLLGILATGAFAALYVGLTVASTPTDYNGVSRWWIVPVAPVAAAILVVLLSIKPVPGPLAIIIPIAIGVLLALVIQEFTALKDFTVPLGENIMKGSRRRLFYNPRDLHLFTSVLITVIIFGWLMFAASYYKNASTIKKSAIDKYFAIAGKVATWRLTLVGVLTVVVALIFLNGWAASGSCVLGLLLGATAAFTIPLLITIVGFLFNLIFRSFWRWINGRS
jgi:hypothetical protein